MAILKQHCSIRLRLRPSPRRCWRPTVRGSAQATHGQDHFYDSAFQHNNTEGVTYYQTSPSPQALLASHRSWVSKEKLNDPFAGPL